MNATRRSCWAYAIFESATSKLSASSKHYAATGPKNICSPSRKPFKAGTTIKASSPLAIARLRSSFARCRVCFLAFVLWKSLEMWQQRAGLGNSPRTILEELARIQSHDVILPTATHGQIRLRCVTQPDPAQAALLDRLGIVLPKRMRLAER